MSDVVLIADDDRDIVCFVALSLRLEGFDVVAAHDGQEALTKALDMQSSLILLDTTMPRMDGYEGCTKLRADECGRTIPVIMLTANSLKADQALAFTVGADDWVTKPFDPAELISKVKHRLRTTVRHGRWRPTVLPSQRRIVDIRVEVVPRDADRRSYVLRTAALWTIGSGDEPRRHGRSRSCSEHGRMAGKVEA
jgi:DNA-binding response OmpR family regulator